MQRIGIIGGTGLYDIEGLTDIQRVSIDTPFGTPSDEFVIGKFADKEIVFLARHGKGHRILPTELNYRANIYGMKKLGVERIISISAVGSLREKIRPLDILLPDQFVDRTNQARATTFFGQGIVAHISFADPTCPDLTKTIYLAARDLKIKVHPRGVYLNMEGPAFSSRAESFLYRSWGMDVIGMTNLPEARLCREAEICFATIALVTDYDCWHHKSEEVNVEVIIRNLNKNVETVKRLLKAVIPAISSSRNCLCLKALENAIVTDPKLVPEETKKKLDVIIGKYISMPGLNSERR
jgi:5'-methylthioadenosine phosphorylase